MTPPEFGQTPKHVDGDGGAFYHDSCQGEVLEVVADDGEGLDGGYEVTVADVQPPQPGQIKQHLAQGLGAQALANTQVKLLEVLQFSHNWTRKAIKGIRIELFLENSSV